MTNTFACKLNDTDLIKALLQPDIDEIKRLSAENERLKVDKALAEDAERNRQELWECLKAEEVLNTARINCPYCNWVLRVTNSPIRSYCEKHWTDLIAIEAQRRNLV